MTTPRPTSHVPPSGSDPTPPLPADLSGGLADALLSLAGPVARGDAIWRLVRGVYESVACVDGDPDHDELASLRRVVDEADAHQARLVSGVGSGLRSSGR